MRDKFFKMRISEKERKLLKSIAKKAGLTESALIREAVYDYVGSVGFGDRLNKPLKGGEWNLFE